MNTDIYVSLDIEANGPFPGDYSMLQLGAAAFQLPSRTPIATFEVNLQALEGGKEDPDTMLWWSKQDPNVWAHVNKDPAHPSVGMTRFAEWAQSLGRSPVLVTYPNWDYMWVTYYLGKFYDGRNPFGLASLDIKSLAMAVMKNDSFKGTAKRKFPSNWFEGSPPHTHKALDDAHGQGVLLVNILCDLYGIEPQP